MKNISNKILFLLTLLVLSSCVKEDDYEIPTTRVSFFSENFQNIQTGTVLDIADWTNFAEKGSVKWKETTFRNEGYAQFNSYINSTTGDAVNIAWLISPKVDISSYSDFGLTFQTAQNFVSDNGNKVEVYIATDYDGTNVLSANWIKIDAIIANKDTKGYTFINSGAINISEFNSTGKINVAFKATGSQTNKDLDGLFQVNDVYVYSNK